MGRLDDRTRDALSRLGTLQVKRPDLFLVMQGEPGGIAYLILDGRVDILRTVENGIEALLAIRHPGDLVGEMAVLRNQGRGATVRTRDATMLQCLPGHELHRFLDDFPKASKALTMATGDRLDQANAYRNDAAAFPVAVRVARALLYQCDRMFGPDRRRPRDWPRLSVDLKQSELAMLIGAKESSVQKALTRDPDLGPLVKSERGRVVILDLEGLAAFAQWEPPWWLDGMS